MIKSQAFECITHLIIDLEMLRDGEWIPDEDSCNASIEMALRVREYIIQLCKEDIK
jgi:hypothetical protein